MSARRFAVILGAAELVVFGAFLILSARNSRPNNTPVSEFLRHWAAVAPAPVVATIGATVVHLVLRRVVPRILLAGISLAFCVFALLQPFDTGDGVCPQHVTALTGTVRGECFRRTGAAASILYAVGIAASVLLATTRRRRSPAR